MELAIQHDSADHRFYAIVDGQECELRYRVISDHLLEYYHTYVPKKLRNQNIASELTRHALDYAQANQFLVIATCSFVRNYIVAHPQYHGLRYVAPERDDDE